MLKADKTKDGYTLLAPYEDEMAGNVDYDYLLGIAALDSGQPDKASLALERVLAVNPNAAGALTSYSANAFDANGTLIGSLQGTSLFNKVTDEPDSCRLS